MITRTVTSPGCLNGVEVDLSDVTDPAGRYAPATVAVCHECGRDEDHCLATKHSTGTACCDPCEARAQICPSMRHACGGDLTGLALAVHTSGACKCREVKA